METVDNRTFKEKVKSAWAGVKIKATDAWTGTKEFVGTHKSEIGFCIMFLGPGILKLTDTAIRQKKTEKDKREDDCDYYDPRTGEHWYTKRPLTTNQRLNLERRYNNGGSKGEILRSMHML